MFPYLSLATNNSGGLYMTGQGLPLLFRKRVLDLNHQNYSQRQMKPSIYLTELRDNMVLDGVVNMLKMSQVEQQYQNVSD